MDKKKKKKEKKSEQTERLLRILRKSQKTRGSGCRQPQAGSALNEVLQLNFNDVDYNVSTQSEVTDYFIKKDLSKP